MAVTLAVGHLSRPDATAIGRSEIGQTHPEALTHGAEKLLCIHATHRP